MRRRSPLYLDMVGVETARGGLAWPLRLCNCLRCAASCSLCSVFLLFSLMNLQYPLMSCFFHWSSASIMSKTQGAFIYPPSNANLSFNYLDMVNVTWNTYGKYTANASLQLWIAEGDKQVYVPGRRCYRAPGCSLDYVNLYLHVCSLPDKCISTRLCLRSSSLYRLRNHRPFPDILLKQSYRLWK